MKILIVIVIDVDSGINFVLIYNFIVNFIGGFYIDFNIGKYVIRKKNYEKFNRLKYLLFLDDYVYILKIYL